MTARAFICSIAGTILTPAERAFLRESEPWGLIVFKRNIETPEQVARLTASFREAVGREAPVLVDQEGAFVLRVHQELAGRGVRTVYLEVRASNASARQLYESLGFGEVARRARYYRRPVEDAVVLRAAIRAEGGSAKL